MSRSLMGSVRFCVGNGVKQLGRKGGAFFLAVLVFAGQSAYGGESKATGDIKAAAKGHLSLIQAGNVLLAYQQTSPDFQALVSLEQYRSLITDRPLLYTIQEVIFPAFDQDGNTVTITARLRFSGGAAADLPMRLRKEGDLWRLLAIDFTQVHTGALDQTSNPLPFAKKTPGPQSGQDVKKLPPSATNPEAEDAARTAIRACLKLIKENKVEEAYEQASSDFKAAAPLKLYLPIFRERPVLRDIEKIDFTEFPESDANIKVYRVHIQTTGGLKFDVPMRMRLEQGAWRMLASDWSQVPVGPQSPVARPTATPEVRVSAPPPSNEPSVGTVIIGAGRTGDGALVRPGQPVPHDAERISADIQLVNHTANARVEAWVERMDGEARTEAIIASIDGQGSGYVPFDLKLGDEGIPVGEYRLVVLLENHKKYVTAFEVR